MFRSEINFVYFVKFIQKFVYVSSMSASTSANMDNWWLLYQSLCWESLACIVLLLSVFSLVIMLDACGCLVQPLVYLWLHQWHLLPRGKCRVAQKYRKIFRSKVYFLYFAKYTLVSEKMWPFLKLLNVCFECHSTFALELVTVRQSYLQRICCSMLHHLMVWYLVYKLPAYEHLHSTSI